MPDAIVIGGGQAGLAMSHHLSKAGIEHVVLERDRVGESWRSQRWDSFALNTPGWFSLLPGDAGGVGRPDGFWGRDEFVRYLDDYAKRNSVPVRTGVTVTAISPHPARNGFVVRTDGSERLEARAVIVAAGVQRVPRIPAFAGNLPPVVRQLHSSAYRNPVELPPGAVLVVGSAQSGVQVAEDLLDAGRTVLLATSRVARLRRRYRGRDMFFWLLEAGFFDQTVAQLPDPSMEFAPQPQTSGVGPLGHSVSLQWLGQRGIMLLGHVEGAQLGRLSLRDDLGANLQWGDDRSADIKHAAEQAIATTGVEADAIESDPGDDPHPNPSAVHAPEELDLEAEGISTIIWTTGVRGDLSFLPGAAVSSDGRPLHHNGVSTVLPGLYFLGFPWLRNRASGILPGAGADAAFLAQRIADTLAAS